MPDEKFVGWLNPLEIFYFDERDPIEEHNPLEILNDLYGTGADHVKNISEVITENHSEITQAISHWQIQIVPIETKIMGKLIWPLRSAKIAFCLKHHLECILLCGIVCEMLVLLIYEILPDSFLDKLDEKYMKKKDKFHFKEYSHYSVGQKKRIEQLKMARNEDNLLEERDKNWAKYLLDKLKENDFLTFIDEVRDKRNDYVHSFDLNYSTIKEDSLLAYKITHRCLKHIFDFKIENGKVVFPPYLDNYYRLRGIIHSVG